MRGLLVAAAVVAMSGCGDGKRSAADIVEAAWRDASYRAQACELLDRASRMVGNDADDMFRRIGQEQGVPEEAQERLLELARRDC